MARGGTRHGSSSIVRCESRDAYMRRMHARRRRAVITGRRNVYPEMTYMVHEPILTLFGCHNLRKCSLLSWSIFVYFIF